MHKAVTILSIATLIMLASCTSKEMYTGVQTSNKVQCLNEPTKAAYDECMKHTEDSYDAYQDKRQEKSNIEPTVSQPRSGY